jgi:hypothetical protein
MNDGEQTAPSDNSAGHWVTMERKKLDQAHLPLTETLSYRGSGPIGFSSIAVPL